MRVIIGAALAIAFSAHAAPALAQEQPPPGDRVVSLQVFTNRVDRYVALHRRFEEPLPPMTSEADSWSMLIAKRYLASAIRSARWTAQQGEIFDPATATVFRELIAEAIGDVDPHAFLGRLYPQHPVTHAEHPIVNEPYPKEITHEAPALVVAHLPRLPEDVEYRIAGEDLLLWDTHADLIVDFVPHAFARPVTTAY